jgi:hypothetical protein
MIKKLLVNYLLLFLTICVYISSEVLCSYDHKYGRDSNRDIGGRARSKRSFFTNFSVSNLKVLEIKLPKIKATPKIPEINLEMPKIPMLWMFSHQMPKIVNSKLDAYVPGYTNLLKLSDGHKRSYE